ncbi:uncharacterized protein LOC134193081 [Corticium candelabrum]|uniref:uncharacterized protein LOC134193081 n=1 Tax=Corticium candelabrum TaxID=121492 RepID=UPI002E26BCC4|nr:uncharacterized protein LOC134193081 [Corticium candelabrum]
MCAIFLKSCLRAAEALESVLKSSYGPNGLDSLIVLHSGDVLMTNDGSTILSCVDVQHPGGKTIIDAVTTFHGRHGNNSKAFVLMVTAALRNIVNRVDSVLETARIGRQMIASQKHVLESMILPVLVQSSKKTSLTDCRALHHVASDILKTQLNGKFSSSVRDFLSLLLLDFVNLLFRGEGSADSNVSEYVARVIDLFPCCCTTVDGLSVRQSRVVDGIVIGRSVVFGIDKHNWHGGYFILLKGDFTVSLPKSAHSTTLATQSVSAVTEWQQCYVAKTAAALHSQGVTLLIMTGICPTSCIQSLLWHKIAVVPMVSEEDIELYAEHLSLNICSLPGVFDLPHNALYKYESIEQLALGKEDCVNIKGVSMKHMVLCAPTRGLAKVYYIALHNALKCLRMWTQLLSNSEMAMAVQGGGFVELLIDGVLRSKILENINVAPEYVDLAAVLQAAVLSIPKALIDNTTVGSKRARTFLATCQRQTTGLNPVGITNVDRFSDVEDVEILEPLYSKYCLLQDVTNLLGHLCQIESVVPVKCVHATHNDDDK